MSATTRRHQDLLAELGLRPRFDHDLPTLVDWLSQKGLTQTAAIFDHPTEYFLPGADALGYRLVGPTGNLLIERSYNCSVPDAMRPDQFTVDQIKKAVEEILSSRRQEAIDRAESIINMLRDTASPPDDVYVGPVIVRVDDVIPADAIILVGNVSAMEAGTIQFGWGTVLEPLYLVVNILGYGIMSDKRYGVFKLCIYELIKRALVVESDGDLNLTLTLSKDYVYLGNAEHELALT